MDYDTELQFNQIDNLPELEELSDWALENPSQDIRNMPLVTASGQTIGIIDEMLVDRSAERVAAVRLQDGRVCPAEQLQIQDDQVLFQQDYSATTAQATAGAATAAATGLNADDTIQIVEEEVAVGTREVVGDTIRVSSRVVTDTVSEDVTLVNEEAYVTTNPVDRVVSSAEADALFAEKTIEVTEINEEAVVGKRAVVTGEVEVGKVAQAHTETITETARRTVVDIDEVEGAATRATASAKPVID